MSLYVWTHTHTHTYTDIYIYIYSLSTASRTDHFLRLIDTYQSWILAAPAQNKCTSLVCSCYVASRNSDSKEEETTRIRTINAHIKKLQFNSSRNYKDGAIFTDKKKKNINASNGLQDESSVNKAPLKSNLKKSVEISDDQLNPGMLRKVSWSDAHGKDIAHVQEFEPSEEGDIGGVGNSCRCAIQ